MDRPGQHRGQQLFGERFVPYSSQHAQRAAGQRHYERNKSQIKSRARKFNAKAIRRNKQFVFDHLSTHPCVDCGEADPVVLEFDHVRGEKVNEVSTMVRNGSSIEVIRNEIQKCEVRCANCHRRVTATRRSQIRKELEVSVERLLFE
jgi:hypothetical protein